MPKGSDPKRSAMDQWSRGNRTVVTTGRGKDSGQVTHSYNRNYVPLASGKTQGAGTYQGKTYAAGSNILDREPVGDYDSTLKTRADDPRNWEHYYNPPSKGRHYSPTKGMSAQERRTDAYKRARLSAQKKAKWEGEANYDIAKINYETARTKAGTKQDATDRTAMGGGRFGSTNVARNVEAQKMTANRKSSRAKSRTTDAFSAPAKTKSSRVA